MGDPEELRQFVLRSLDAIHKTHVGPLVQAAARGTIRGPESGQVKPLLFALRGLRSALSEVALCVEEWEQVQYHPKAIA